jgi:DNA-binding response OmpR family regulator
LKNFLSARGYHVRSACDGADAIEEYQKNKPDVVLLDIALPKMNGIEVLRRIKEINRSTDVIMLSAYGDSLTIRGTFKMGANYFLEKPLEVERLLNILEVLA